MQAKKWWLGVGVLFLVVIAIFIVRTVQSEKAYPTPKIQQADFGEPIHFNGCDIRVTECSFRAMDESERLEASLLEGEQGGYIITKFSVENTSDSPSTIIPDYFILQHRAWKNGADPLASSQLNEGGSFPKVLYPGDLAEVYLCFPIYDFMLKPGDWENADQWQYELVINNYPLKQSLLCTPEV